MLLALAFVLFLSSASALPYNITSHEINVEADREGNAVVSEKYFMVFEGTEGAGEFARIKNAELGFDLAKYGEFDSMLKINFGAQFQKKSLKVEFVEEPSGEFLYCLEFRYSFEVPAFNKSETGRRVLFEINKSFVKPLVRRTEFVIPAGTTLTFILPAQSEPEGGLLNNQNVRIEGDSVSRRVIIPGSFSSNDFDFGYSFFKPISPSLSIAKLVKGFSENTSRETQLAIAFVLGMVLLALYAGRNRIERKVTGFVIRNSDLLGEELEEGNE